MAKPLSHRLISSHRQHTVIKLIAAHLATWFSLTERMHVREFIGQDPHHLLGVIGPSISASSGSLFGSLDYHDFLIPWFRTAAAQRRVYTCVCLFWPLAVK